MNRLIKTNNKQTCLNCIYSYSKGYWDEPNLYCSKYNIKGNPDIIGIRNHIPNFWINNGLNCNGFKRKQHIILRKDEGYKR